MAELGELFQFIPRYAVTARDAFMNRQARRFANAVRSGDSHYLKPLPFLIVSLLISGAAAFTAAMCILSGSAQTTLNNMGFLGTTVIVTAVWLENLFIVLIAKCCAFALGLPVSLSSLFDGYCYASVLFPAVVTATALAFLGVDAPNMDWLWLAGLVQFFFLAAACHSMARFATVDLQYSWRLAVGTFLFLTTTSVLAGVAFGYVESEDERSLQPTCRTVGVENVAATHADLKGAFDGNRTQEWFAFDTTPALTYSVAALNGSGTVCRLKPNTKYYFSYAVKNAYKRPPDEVAPCRGEVVSFTTAPQ